MEEEMLHLQNEIESFCDMAKNDLQSKKKTLENTIKLKVSIAIAMYCEENSIKFLCSKEDLLYCESDTDFTTDLIDFIN